jgi:micrococcal nuclease
MSAAGCRAGAALQRVLSASVALILLAGLAGCAASADAGCIISRLPQNGIESTDAGPKRPVGAVAVIVDRVTDGDTLRVTDGVGTSARVRLIGVDTPETGNSNTGNSNECYAAQATARLTELAPAGAKLWAMTDIEKTDSYGRLLLYLWTSDGIFINFTLVAEGLGTALMVPPNDRYYPELRHAEALAGAQGLGLWASCR